jgi:mono/diheme cytochrome c family protein
MLGAGFTAAAALAIGAGVAPPSTAVRAGPARVSFARDIRPILASNCFKCHGPDDQARQASLRLDTREGATDAARKGGGAIVPGRPESSPLMSRVASTDPHRRMPPPEVNPHGLSAEQVELIGRWIEQGAAWEEHWSFKPLASPRLARVDDDSLPWCRQPLDHFTLAGLHEHGLAPSPEASRSTLLRRLSLDLIGLPPTPEEQEAFEADTRPDAYERVVDRLLASPRFGERWARWWLDLARYADTMGYEKDLRRTIWPYRDWVIRAFNANMPFDRFTIEQLAGDLLPMPSTDQLVATAFHRNTMTNDEGGTDDEEFRIAAVIDRTNTTMEVWQGLTFACAQCHTHKYDPINQTEYYRLLALFNTSEDRDRVDEAPTIEPQAGVKVPVMREQAAKSARVTHRFTRGSFLSPAERVTPGVPKVLWNASGSEPRIGDRLQLAAFLTSRGNPLTARVMVNRVWESLFGAGLVETVEDLGTQSPWPANVDLIDHLAASFRDGAAGSGPWDFKSLLRRIVTSATYRQASTVTPELLAADPGNRLLGRSPRVRLDAESVRDAALAASGLLSSKMYGPSVFPLQPEGVWQIIYSDDQWKTSQGEDAHRRSLYTFIRRTSPHPAMTTFDAPSREVCVSRRVRTNTPLQAFVLLNDPQFVECSKALGERVMRERSTDDGRLDRLFRLVLCRDPSPAERDAIRPLVRTAKEPSAGWTLAASTVLNLDEAVTRE